MADTASRTGTRYETPALRSYLEQLHAPHDQALARAFEAPAREGLPQIQVGPSEGRLLELLLTLIAPRKVVEIGTLTGYSAMWMARALAAGGQLWTLEREPQHHRVASALIAEAGLTSRVTCLQGDAVSALPALASAHAPFDAVFLDADKGHYDLYGRWAALHLRPGGLLLADNAFFFGRLLDDNAEAAAMRRFHEESTRAFATVCIPTPDGLLLGLKR